MSRVSQGGMEMFKEHNRQETFDFDENPKLEQESFKRKIIIGAETNACSIGSIVEKIEHKRQKDQNEIRKRVLSRIDHLR